MYTTFGAALLLAGLAQANYISGEVTSTETFTYGRFSLRMQGADTKGTVGSFFTYWKGPNWSQAGWNEIDVELVPSMEDPMSMNIISAYQAQDQEYCEGFRPGSDWNDYVVEWAPTYISWFINGNMVRRLENQADVTSTSKPQYLMMNFWTPTFAGWGDNFDASLLPTYTRYDYIKVETYNAATGEFEPHWQDDFDSFDASRWIKSENWNFGGSSTTFFGSQVYTENGALVIKMDMNEESFIQ